MKILLGCVVAFIAGTATAQMTDDIVPRRRTLPIASEVRLQLERSRWQVGALRVAPWLAIRDLGYENNVYATAADPVSDWRSTVSGGGTFILPFGHKTYLRGGARPSYIFYKKLAERRTFGGNYDTSLLALFNRVSFDIGGDMFRGTQPVSTEIPRGAISVRRGTHATGEVYVLQRLGLFASAVGSQQRYSETADERRLGLSLSTLERNESAARAGLHYRFRSFLDFSLGAERTTATFLTDSTKNNETSAVLLGVHYDRPRTFLSLSVGNRTGTAVNHNTRFPKFSTVTGSYYGSHELASKIALEAYGQRGLGYSATPENPYYVESRNGVAVIVPLGYRIATRAYAEAGVNDYTNPVMSIKRSDKTRVIGGGFVVHLHRTASLTIGASRDSVTSNVAGNDRSIFRLTTALTFGGNLFQ